MNIHPQQNRILQLLQNIPLIYLLLHFYWQCYSYLYILGITFASVDKALLWLNENYYIFFHALLIKLFILSLLFVTTAFSTPIYYLMVKDLSKTKKILLACTGISLYFFSNVFLIINCAPKIATISYILLTLSGYQVFKFLFHRLKLL